LTLSSKKGQSFGYFEIVLVVAIMFIIAVAWLVTNSIGTDINQYLLDDGDFLTDNASRTVLENVESSKTNFLDGAFVLFFLGMFFLGGISAWFSGSNPIFFVVTFLFIIMVLVVPVLLSGTWEQLTDEFSSTNLTFMNWIMNNHLLFSVVFVFFVLGVMYFRTRVDL
jgi:Na+/melibiose symporter-like transporter